VEIAIGKNFCGDKILLDNLTSRQDTLALRGGCEQLRFRASGQGAPWQDPPPPQKPDAPPQKKKKKKENLAQL